MAYTDPLTGLGNRYRMRDKVAQISAERASDPAPFTIGIANLDGFKPINDLFGSAAGDEILCQVAHRLKACIPDGATVTRHDGDEFAFVLPLIFERASAEKFGQMIREVLSAPYDLGDRNVRLSASFGFAIYPFAGEEFEELLKSAETALYRSKRRGRGQITVYSREIAQEMKRATQLEQALRNAIISDAIDVHFQPIVSLSNNQVVGFEALARWNDPDLGFVSPAVFVPLAEERGFIDALSETLLRKAAEAALSWPRELFLSFNLSSAQLMDPGTSSNVLSILGRVGFDPHRLELEITETAVMSSADTAHRIISDLRAGGRAHLARRFRHRPVEPRPPARFHLRQGQDRPRLRLAHQFRPRLRAHHQGDPRRCAKVSISKSLPKASRIIRKPRSCGRSAAAWDRAITSASLPTALRRCASSTRTITTRP